MIRVKHAFGTLALVVMPSMMRTDGNHIIGMELGMTTKAKAPNAGLTLINLLGAPKRIHSDKTDIKIHHVPTSLNMADILTKALSRETFVRCIVNALKPDDILPPIAQNEGK